MDVERRVDVERGLVSHRIFVLLAKNVSVFF